MDTVGDIAGSGGNSGRASAVLHAAMETMIDPLVILSAVRDDQGTVVDFEVVQANAAVERATGTARDLLVGRPLRDVFPRADLEGLVEWSTPVVDSGEPVVADRVPFSSEPDDPRLFDVRIVKVGDGVSLTWRDVTERDQAERALSDSEQLYRLVVDNVSDIIFRSTTDVVFEWVSPSVRRVLGWDPERLVGASALEYVHPEDLLSLAPLITHVGTAETIVFEGRFRTADGGYRTLSTRYQPILGEDGLPVGGVAVARDITTELEALADLAKSEEQFRLAMASAPIGMAVVDLDRRFVTVNPALCTMLGRDEEWLLSHRVSDVLHPGDEQADLAMLQELRDSPRQSVVRRKRFVDAGGHELTVEHAVGILRDSQGRALWYVSQFVDVTEAEAAQQRLNFLATHDALTALENRHSFTERMDRILSHPPRVGANVGVLFIDVDNLKPVNDTHGHGVGDALLVEVANRIRRQVRADDIVARIGGDEFVVALPSTRVGADAVGVAEKIHAALREPVRVGDIELPASVSIGVSVASPGDHADRVIAEADKALLRAKRDGRNRTVAYDAELD